MRDGAGSPANGDGGSIRAATARFAPTRAPPSPAEPDAAAAGTVPPGTHAGSDLAFVVAGAIMRATSRAPRPA
jgi:hypothetical protein